MAGLNVEVQNTGFQRLSMEKRMLNIEMLK